jgi:hypothetical protein
MDKQTTNYLQRRAGLHSTAEDDDGGADDGGAARPSWSSGMVNMPLDSLICYYYQTAPGPRQPNSCPNIGYTRRQSLSMAGYKRMWDGG